MKKTAKILFCCYTAEPLKGSEPGVGWNVPFMVAKQCPHYEVYLLTKSSKKEKIESYLKDHPIKNLHPLFYAIPSWLKVERFGFARQFNYIAWELLVKSHIKKWDECYHFNLIHHITFNQYRTPSPGFWLDKPFVMGPVGGAETIHPVFYQDLSSTTVNKEKYRQKGRDFKLFGWLNRRNNNKKLILFSSVENESRLKPYCGNSNTQVLPAIAFDESDFPSRDKHDIQESSTSTFEMTYAGRPLDWKGLLIFLKAANMAFVSRGIKDFKIKLIGIRDETEQKMVMQWAKEQQLTSFIELIPFIPRPELLKILQTCNLSVYPAFRDSGSMSILEAAALGCPSICFNAGGQDAFPNDVLLKVELADDYNVVLSRFADKLLWVYHHQDESKQIGNKAQEYVYKNLTWQKKAETFDSIYQTLI